MGAESKWMQTLNDECDKFCKLLDEKIEKEQQQMKACKKKTELDIKLAQELKLNNELQDRLDELLRRTNELDRVCASLDSLSIADSDKNRLENAEEAYQLAKELTGIRFNFQECKGLTVAKGYIKSVPRKLLQPFKVPAGDSEALWALIQSTADPVWPDKENQPHN